MSNFWIQDYDPKEDEKTKEILAKFFTFAFVGLTFFCLPSVRLWIGLWVLLGVFSICLRIYLSGLRLKISDWRAFIRKEIFSGLKSGEITRSIFFVWFFDLLFTTCCYFFGSRDFSFSRGYYDEQIFHYLSGKGKYYGMHTDTACELADAGVKNAQEKGEQVCARLKEVPAQIEQKSKFALAFSVIMGFLTAPLGLAKTQKEEKQAEKSLYSFFIFDLGPEFKFSMVKLGLKGTKGRISYLSEIDLVQGENESPKLSRVFLEYNFNKNLKAKIGHMFTPTIWFIPAPPDSPTIQSLAIINEMSVTKSGFALEYDNHKNFSVETMLTQDESQKPRLISRITRSFSQFKFLLALDLSRKKNRLGSQVVFSQKKVEVNVGGFLSSKGFTAHIQGLIKPFKWAEGVIRYERSPWLESKERLLAGFSLFLEGIRFRFTWVPNELRAQATYKF